MKQDPNMCEAKPINLNDFLKRRLLKHFWFFFSSKLPSVCVASSVTRLGDFFKFLVTNYLSKVAQILWWLFGISWKHHFFRKNGSGYIFGQLEIKLGYFFNPLSGHAGRLRFADCGAPVHKNLTYLRKNVKIVFLSHSFMR